MMKAPTESTNQLLVGQKEDEGQVLHNLAEQQRMIGVLGQIITSEINLDRLLELIVNQMSRLMHAETCSVFLYDADADELWSMVSSDLEKNMIRISARCGISGWVYSHQTPQIVNQPYDDPRFFKGVDRKKPGLKHETYCAFHWSIGLRPASAPSRC